MPSAQPVTRPRAAAACRRVLASPRFFLAERSAASRLKRIRANAQSFWGGEVCKASWQEDGAHGSMPSGAGYLAGLYTVVACNGASG